tara:strand:- start:3 stop:1634 length:1632 start_codon:yes stop_codon:yes gene_type:complete
MSTRAAAYLRVSTTRQADHDLSLPDQLRKIEAFCEAKGWDLVRTYEERGASATTDKRPEFRRMIGEACANTQPFDIVIVYSLSRFARDATDAGFYERKLEQSGVQLYAVLEDFGNDANGRLIKGVLNNVYEHQSRYNSIVTSNAMLENARQGFWNGSAPPYGYRTYVAARVGKKEKKKLELEPKEAEIVKMIFQLYLYGDGKSGPLGVKNLVSYLNDLGLKHRKTPFRAQTVHALLRKTAYIGEHFFNRNDSRTGKLKPREEWVPLEVPRIVEDCIFHSVQAQLSARNPKKTAPRISNSTVLLTGVAKCGECGGSMRLRTGKGGKYRYYTCSAKVDKGTTACSGGTIPMQKLDDLVTDAICERVLEPRRLGEIVGALFERNSGRKETLQHELRELHNEKRDLSKQVQNLLDLMETGGLEVGQAIRERYSKRHSELEEINRMIAFKQREIDTPLKALKPSQIEEVSKALGRQLRDSGNISLRRAYLRTMLNEVIVSNDEIHISGPKAVLAHALSNDTPLAPSMVPTFVDGWRTGEDSNSRPLDS